MHMCSLICMSLSASTIYNENLQTEQRANLPDCGCAQTESSICFSYMRHCTICAGAPNHVLPVFECLVKMEKPGSQNKKERQ